MGAGIAQVSVENGYRVLMKDENNAGVARGQTQIKTNLDQKVKKRSLKAFDRDLLLSKVVPLTPDNPNWLKHFATADVVIEAVPENLALKHKVVRAPLCFLCHSFPASPWFVVPRTSLYPPHPRE
jgi:3-hydroxyacyl-CoA dehydrogenase